MPTKKTIERMLAFARRDESVDLEVLRDAFELTHLHHLLDRHIEDKTATRGLNARQAHTLEMLYFNQEATVIPAELADEVCLTRSAMTSCLDSLEKAGYTCRSQHPSDRRMVEVTLTEAGRAVIEEYLPERYFKMSRVIGELSATERKTMLRAYAKLLKAIEAVDGLLPE